MRDAFRTVGALLFLAALIVLTAGIMKSPQWMQCLTVAGLMAGISKIFLEVK